MSIKQINEDGTLVPARNLPNELFLDFDRRDEDQIVAELIGAAAEEYVYSFGEGRNKVTGLSVTGVMAVAQNLGGITCGTPHWEITDDEYYCEIAATDHHCGLTVWGNASQERRQQTRNGNIVDKFARQKALSKAQRNAIRKVIPEAIATQMLQAFLSGKRPSQISKQQRSEPRYLDAPESRVSVGHAQNTQLPVSPRNTPQGQQNAPQQGFNRDLMRGQPQTDAQRRRLHAIANEGGWTRDQIHGRAAEINQNARESLDALDKAEISELMDAIANEQPWVDPRQQRMDMSGPPPTEAEYREVADDDWTPPKVTGDFETDVRIVADRARAVTTSAELAHLWRFTRSLQLDTDPELKSLFAARRRELKPDHPTS